jgi:hypothetical protein
MAEGDFSLSSGYDSGGPNTTQQADAAAATPPPAQVEQQADPTPAPQQAQSDNTDQGTTSSDMVAEGHRLMKESEDHIQAWQGKTQPYYDQYEKALKESPPPPPQYQQYQPPPTVEANRKNLFTSLLHFAAIAVPLAVAFGHKGGRAGWAAIGALGHGLENLMKGNEAQYKDSMEQWRYQNEQIRETNTQKMDMYKNVLANKKLSMDQQMDLIGVISKQFGDEKLHDATKIKDWQHTYDNLLKKEGALQKHKEWEQKEYPTLQKQLGKDKEMLEYRQIFKDRHGFDPYPDDEGALSSDQKKQRGTDSFEKWQKEEHAIKSTKAATSAPGSDQGTSDNQIDDVLDSIMGKK